MERLSVRDLITQAAEEHWEELNLSGMGLSELPLEIGQLTNLTSLNLSSNILKAFPEVISQLTNLTSLDISNNQLNYLSDFLCKLSNLKSLNLCNNQFKELPDLIGELNNLTSLNLGNNQLDPIPGFIGKLRNLESLNLSYNHIAFMPELICELTNLTSLNIAINQLKYLPESIGNLANLTSLNLSVNQLKNLPESFCKLTKLISLNLNRNKIKELPELIKELTNLKILNLGNNQFRELPVSIGNLANLESIDLNGNQIKYLPVSICELNHLNSLNLNSNRLTYFPISICELINLKSLDISNNNINALPELIGQLTNLTSFYLGYNQLNTLPESIGQLINLTSLDFRQNKLNDLPESIGNLLNLISLIIYENPLTQILPEIVEEGGLAVLHYYRQRLEETTDYIYEAKLLIIGEGGAGKTSLANKLIDSNYKLKPEGSDNPEKSTEGIDVLRFDFPHSSGNDFRINIWDFGGQEIYHATHQFFLTKRSLYLLVADTRQDNTDFNYWLEVVELLSGSSPALIVKNEKQDRLCQVNENQLRGRFPNLEKILPTNLSDNRGLSDILAAIQHHISQLPHIGQPLPKTWVRVRAALEADSRNYITQSEFLTLCDTNGFKRHEDKLQLSGYLHDLGVCLHFQDDPILKNIVILKPEWGTAAVYKVLDTKQVNQNFGCFTQADLTEIWLEEQYTQMRDELLQLMKNFKLCYEIPNHPKNYIAPQLLSPNQPEYDWDETDNLILRYHYDFMPKGMLTRFSVEMHRLIKSDLIWKDGVIIADNNARAEVIEVYYKKEIRIRVSGFFKKDLLTRIYHEFDKIHNSYEKLRYQILIPCSCPICKGSQNPHAYELQKLKERLQNKTYEIQCDKPPYNKVNVSSLMDDAIGQKQSTRSTENDRTEEYSKEAYEDMRDIAKLAVSREINIEQKQTMTDESKYANDFKGANIANFANEVKDNARQQANQNNYAAPSQSLAAAAKEIKDLLNQISATDTTNNPTLIAIKAIESIEKNPTLKDRIINAGKEAGFAALDAAVDHPAVKIVTAAIKGAIDGS